jgi:caffeoyl-CoA O-methyltransferase
MNKVSCFALAVLEALCIVAMIALIITIAVSGCTTGASAKDDEVFDIPKIDDITIDGRDNDWGVRGFRVDHIAAPNGTVLPARDFDVRFRLGWNETGLLVLVTVQDDIAWEAPERVWRFDCVELYVGDHVGSENYYQVIVNSGADPEFGSTRQRIFDKRPEHMRESGLAAETASRTVEGGYVVEALLPWENLGIEAGPGTGLAFQLTANDADGGHDPSNETESSGRAGAPGGDSPGGPLRVAWYPDTETHSNPGLMHALRLAEEPDKPVLLRIDRETDLDGANIYVRGVKELAGRHITVLSGKKTIAERELKLQDGRAAAVIHLDFSRTGTVPRLDVELSGEPIASFDELPTVNRVLERYAGAAGGTGMIKKLTTRSCTARLTHEFPLGSASAESTPVDAVATASGMWAVTLHYTEGDLEFGCDGKAGWVKDSEGYKRDERMDRLPLGLLLSPHGAVQIKEYFGELTLKEQSIQDSRAVYHLQVNDGTGSRPILFDVESGLLIQIGSWSVGDYQEIDGVKFPHRIAAARRGGESVYRFDEVRHNEPLDDDRFMMPDSAIMIKDVFGGIDDARVLPMLKHLPYRYGGMNIPPRDGRLLYNLILSRGYKRGLEIGTSNGYSTLWLALAFRETGGEVITLEIEEPSGMEARENFKKSGLDGVIDSRIVDAFEEIPRIEDQFDFVFIDAWKPDYPRFLKLLRDRVSPGGAITAHNVLSHGSDMRAFLDAIESDPGLETTIYRTSEAGVSVSIVRK